MLSAIKLHIYIFYDCGLCQLRMFLHFHTNQFDSNVLDFSLIRFHHKYIFPPWRACLCLCVYMCFSVVWLRVCESVSVCVLGVHYIVFVQMFSLIRKCIQGV